MINKVPPVAAKPTPEAAVFDFTYLTFTGTGMLIAAIISGFLMGFSPAKMIGEYGRTIKLCAISLITISAMLAHRHADAALRRRRHARISPSPQPACSIPSSARCSAGSAWR